MIVFQISALVLLHFATLIALIPKAHASTQCNGNLANGYPCLDVNLEAFLPPSSINDNDKKLNDIWGWTDTNTGKEYALVGKEDGTAFVDVSAPESPVYLGFLEGHNGLSVRWRDIKTYKNYAFIVSDVTMHGMQIFDLTGLTNVTSTPVMFSETAHFEFTDQSVGKQAGMLLDFMTPLYEEAAEFDDPIEMRRVGDEGFAHNVFINEDSGFAYVVGSNNCNGGLYMLDITIPLVPTFAGCYSGVGWVHDTQCVIYDGPDSGYTGREICFVSHVDAFAIVDVTDKSNPVLVSELERSDFVQIHQGWLTEDKSFFLLSDRDSAGFTTAYIVDVSNLDAINIANTYIASFIAHDSNLFVKGNFVYQANHRAGLRILDSSQILGGILSEVAFFDTTPDLVGSGKDGVWGVYPFFESGIVILSSIREGLFIVRPIAFDVSSFPSNLPSSRFRPSLNPSSPPSILPSSSPHPSFNPSSSPSNLPSYSLHPSIKPSTIPSIVKSLSPSQSSNPTVQPSLRKSKQPSDNPSYIPSKGPSKLPSLQPTDSSIPSESPTLLSSLSPSTSSIPSLNPTAHPSVSPTSIPTEMPTVGPPFRDEISAILFLLETFLLFICS